jgi:hypothetical protein
MAFEFPLLRPGIFVAAEDLSTHQFKFVKVTANGVVRCTVDGEYADGVLQNNPAAGQAAEVEMRGITRVVVATSEALAVGDFVGTTTAATATVVNPTATGADLGDHMLGRVLEAATGSSPAGVLATISFAPIGRVTA